MTGTLTELCAEAAALAGIPEDEPAALYLSAGMDTKQFVLLSRFFLNRRGVPEVPAPTIYVLVDRNIAASHPEDGVLFDDGSTRITVDRRLSAFTRLTDLRISLQSVLVTSGEPLVAGPRAVIRVQGDNRAVVGLAVGERWAPDVLVTVCDGCAFGGNDRCESVLHRSMYRRGPLVHRLAGPNRTRWWATDHFGRHFRDIGQILNDDILVPPDGIPFLLRKRAKLASDWGHPWPPFLGGTLFEVCERPAPERGTCAVRSPPEPG